MFCGVCGSSSYHSSLICSGCMNQALLKYRTQQIDNDYSSNKFVRDIDGILKNCIDNKSYSYIKSHQSEYSGSAETEDLSLKLAQQLLNIEIMQLKKSLLSKKDKIDKLNVRNNQLRSMTVELQAKNNAARKELNTKHRKIAEEFQAAKSELQQGLNTETNSYRQIMKNISGLQSKLSQQLIEISNLQNKNEVFYLSLVPIVPINRYLEYPYEIINTNLLNICNFILRLSQYMLVSLSFAMVFPKENITSKINAKQNHFNYVELQPIVLYRNECYPLYLTKNMYELNKYELNLFVKAISCLILNIVNMISVSQKTFNWDDYSMDKLVDLGGLIWRLISSEGTAGTVKRKESFLRIFWNLQKYGQNTVARDDLNLHVEKLVLDAKISTPSIKAKKDWANLDMLSLQLYKVIAGDIQQYRNHHKEQFPVAPRNGTTNSSGSKHVEQNWEVI